MCNACDSIIVVRSHDPCSACDPIIVVGSHDVWSACDPAINLQGSAVEQFDEAM